MEEFNVDWKVECDQSNLAHVTEMNEKKKKLKRTHASVHLVWSRFNIPEGSPHNREINHNDS